MPRHEIHSMKIKDIKIALDHYLNPLQKEKYRDWFLLKKADLVKLIFENNIQDEIVKLNKKLKLTPKYSVKQFPLKVLKKIIIKILTPDLTEDFENWAVITKPQLIKLIIKHNLENKIFEKLTAKQAVKFNVPKKELFKNLPIEDSEKEIEEGEYKAEIIETKPKKKKIKVKSKPDPDPEPEPVPEPELKPEDIKQKLMMLVLNTPTDILVKSLIKLGFKGKLETNPMRQMQQIQQNFKTTHSMQELIDVLEPKKEPVKKSEPEPKNDDEFYLKQIHQYAKEIAKQQNILNKFREERQKLDSVVRKEVKKIIKEREEQGEKMTKGKIEKAMEKLKPPSYAEINAKLNKAQNARLKADQAVRQVYTDMGDPHRMYGELPNLIEKYQKEDIN